ncbi:unnamed protein product [Heterobilharzia americana]|nr:unnamed protein product [Heterobilharzia americana]
MEQLLANFNDLEECLISDDVFESYFNYYLSLPVFSRKLQYNRLSGEFISFDPYDFNYKSPMNYGLSDEDRERVVQWAEAERMPHFLRSDVYRELILCKLLAAPLELNSDHTDYWVPFEAELESTFTGPAGISRQTRTSGDSNISSYENGSDNNDSGTSSQNNQSTTSNVNSGSNESTQIVNESIPSEFSDVTSGRRRSREYSKYFKTRRLSMFEGNLPRVNDFSRPSPLVEQTSCEESSRRSDDAGANRLRRQSEPIKSLYHYYYYYNSSRNDTFDTLEFVQDSLRQLNSKQENSETNLPPNSSKSRSKLSDNISKSVLHDEVDIENVFHEIQAMEERQNIPMQQLKEILLSSRDGMRDFMAFLVTTSGIHLVDFWLDCEAIKMVTSEEDSGFDRVKMKFDLIRDLEDRYLLRLTPKARQKLFTSINTISDYFMTKCCDPEESYICQLGDMMFDCVQYDCLRRLRYYWLARWLLHWERIIRNCQFMPSGLGGSALFYIPSQRSSTVHSGKNYFNDNRRKVSSNVNTENLSLDSSDIEQEDRDYDDDDMRPHKEYDEEAEREKNDEVFEEEEELSGSVQQSQETTRISKDEKSWNQEIYDTVVKNALSKGGLIKSDLNREILRNMPSRRLKSQTSSTLASSTTQTSRTGTQISRMSSGTFKKCNLDRMNYKSRIPLFKKLNVSWTIPYDPNDVIGLKKYPGSKWEGLRSKTFNKSNMQLGRLNTVYQKSSVVIESFITTLGLNNYSRSDGFLQTPKNLKYDSQSKTVKQKLLSKNIKLPGKELEGKYILGERQQEGVPSNADNSKYASLDTLKKKCLSAIHADAASGGPFQFYLERNCLETQSRMLGFLQALHDHVRQNLSPMPNRFSKLAKTWYIVNNFLRSGSRWDLNIDPSVVKLITETIQTKKDLTPVQIFDPVKSICLNDIFPFWIDYLKFDAFQFAYAAHNSKSEQYMVPKSAEDFDVLLDENSNLIVQRKPVEIPQPATSSSLLKRSSSWDYLTPAEKEERIRLKLEQVRITERERRKAILAARRRQREALKPKKQDSSLSGLIKVDTTQSDEENETDKHILEDEREMQSRRTSNQTYNLKSMINNKLLISVFQEWLNTLNTSELNHNASNHLAFILEVGQYLSMSTNQLNLAKIKHKIDKVNSIYANYLRESCEKPIELPAKFIKRLDQEKDRPTSATLKGLRDYHLTNLSSLFNGFLSVTAKKFGLSVLQLCQMPEIDLATLVGTPKTANQMEQAKQKFSIKARPMLEDKEELSKLLKRAAFQPPDFRLVLFYQYLVDYGSRENCPLIDQDLIFHIEVLRFEVPMNY